MTQRIKFFSVALTVLLSSVSLFAQTSLNPTSTHRFAQKDGTDLYLDVYDPAPGSQTTLDGKEKPTIIFVFGGGFIMGSRNEPADNRWYKMLTDNGYRVVANDYRLGLRGVKNVGISSAKAVKHAIDIAVEDLFDATAYLIAHADELGINKDNIVVSGSSAGAITSMQAEWLISNGDSMCSVLPKDFNYKGVMSFAGAIFSDHGRIRYANDPAPLLLLHGTKDRIVNYNQIWFFNLRFAGSNVIWKTLKKGGYNYNIYRFETYGHEIASEMIHQFDKEIQFLEDNVIRGKKLVIDATVDDQSIPRFTNLSSRDDLYKE